jgi:hypothetical protein
VLAGTLVCPILSSKQLEIIIMRKTIAAVAIAASTVLTACHAGAQDGGRTVSRNYQVGNFQQIEVAGPYDVTVRTGGNAAVSAQGGEELLDRTTVEVEGDKLVIRPEHDGGLFHFGFGTRGSASFTVTVPQLSGATLTGSGDIHVDRVAGQQFAGTVTGSGGLDVGTMDVQQAKLTVTGSGDLKGGTGKVQTAEYEIAGSGDLDASSVQTQQIKASIQGSGSIKAHGSGTADINIMGSGDVEVSGGAKCNVSKMGSGDAHCS